MVPLLNLHTPSEAHGCYIAEYIPTVLLYHAAPSLPKVEVVLEHAVSSLNNRAL